MTKKQKVIYFFKLFGIAAAIAVGFIAVITCYVAIVGGFNKKVIEVETMSFSKENEFYVADDSSGNPVYVINKDSLIMCIPNPSDATELEATLKIDSANNLVDDIMVWGTLEDETEGYVSATKVEGKENTYNILLNQNFLIKLKDTQEESLNRIFTMYCEHLTDYCRASVFVDAEIQNYSLTYTKIDAATLDEQLFPGDYIDVYVDTTTLTPSTSLTMNNIISQVSKYKTIEFETSNQDIAIIESVNFDSNGIPKARVHILTDGEFSISSSICRLYKDENKILTDEEYSRLTIEGKKEYEVLLYGQEAIDENNDGENEQEAIVGILCKVSTNTLTSQAIKVENISCSNDTLSYALFSTHKIKASDIALKLNPQNVTGSCYTSDDLEYLLSEVTIKGGFFVSSEEQADATVNGKYIKFSNQYINVTKSFDSNNKPIWTVVIEDYKSNIEPTNCLYIEYVETTTDEDNHEVKTTFSCYASLTITKVDVPSYKIKIGDGTSQSLDLTAGITSGDGTEIISAGEKFSLDSAKLPLLSDSTKSLGDSTSQYRTTLFVTTGEGGKFVFVNDIITIYNKNLSTKDNEILATEIVANNNGNTGTCYVYSIVVKTNRLGQFVNSKNEVITDYSSVENFIILFTTEAQNSLIINIYKKLEINTNKVQLYEKDTNYTQIVDTDKSKFDIDNTDKVTTLTMYLDSTGYLLLDYNDEDSYIKAIDSGELVFSLTKSIILINNLVTVRVGEKNIYLLPIQAVDVLSSNSVDTLTITLSKTVIYSITITTQNYVLESMTIESNASDTNTDTTTQIKEDSVKLNLKNDEDGEFLWQAIDNMEHNVITIGSNSTILNNNLTITSKIFPNQAIISDITYKFYNYDEINPLNLSDFDATKLSTMIENTEIIEIAGNPVVSDDVIGEEKLYFNIKKSGRVYFVAYYTREDNVTVISNPILLDIVKLDAEYSLNYGDDDSYSTTIDTNKYQKVYTSKYEMPTDLNGKNNNSAGINKVNAAYKENAESSLIPLNTSFLKYEIIQGGIENALYLDGSDLITPMVSENHIVKIKVSTTFGDEIGIYNYVLVPDVVVDVNTSYSSVSVNYNNNQFKFGSDATATLFKMKVDASGKIVNDGGMIFVHSSDYTNNKLKINGNEVVINIIYLTSTFGDTDGNITANGLTTLRLNTEDYSKVDNTTFDNTIFDNKTIYLVGSNYYLFDCSLHVTIPTNTNNFSISDNTITSPTLTSIGDNFSTKAYVSYYKSYNNGDYMSSELTYGEFGLYAVNNG